VSAGHFANSFSLRVKLIRNQQNEQKTKKAASSDSALHKSRSPEPQKHKKK